MHALNESIQNLDLRYLGDRLIDKENWTHEMAQNAVRRYKNFLTLIARYPDLYCVPCLDIDEVWHAHILHTEEYMRDCDLLFGRYLHHRPFRERGDQKAMAEMQNGFYQTAELYRKEFGEFYSLDMDIGEFW
jgi:hypothetical protein